MRVLKDWALVGTSHFVTALTVIVVQIVLARMLPVEQFGALVLLQAVVVFVEGCVTARAGEVALYAIGRNWNTDFPSARGYAIKLHREEVRWGVLSYVALGFAALGLQPALGIRAQDLWILALTIPVQSGYGVSKAVFISSENLRAQSVLEIAYSLFYAVAVSLAVFIAGVTGFMIAYVTAAMLKTLVARVITKGYWPPMDNAVVGNVPNMRVVSGHSILRNLCNNAANQGDLLILGAFAPKEIVAIYKVARTLSALPGRVAGPLWSILRPRLVRLIREGDVSGLRREIAKPALAITALGMAFFPLAWYFSEPVLQAVYGIGYGSAASPLLILLVGSWIFGAITGWVGTVAIMTSRKAITSLIYAALAILIACGSLMASGVLLTTAISVSTALIVVSAFTWIWLFTDTAVCK